MKKKTPRVSQLVGSLLLTAVATAACGTSLAALSEESPKPEPSTPVDVTSPHPIGNAIARILDAPEVPETMRIFTRCRDTSDELEQLEIFGDGLVIWNGSSQLRIARQTVLAFLHFVHDAGFAAMPDSFGGNTPGGPAVREPVERAPVKLLCEVEIEIDGIAKRVEQLDKGEQSAELRSIASEMLGRIRDREPLGVRAEGIADGLRKLASGALDPRTFKLTLHERPESLSESSTGLLLELRGREATVREFRRGSGYSSPRELALSAEQSERFFLKLAAVDVEELPVNLYAEDYLDLTLEVLDQRLSVQARRFAGMEPETLGPQQLAFEKLVAAVRKLLPESSALGAA